MWPFKRTPRPEEIDTDRHGLTADERLSVRTAFHNFTSPDGRRIGLETHPEEIHRALIARGLWDFAEQKMEAAGFYAHTTDRAARDSMMDKAIEAIGKAYNAHRLPIYIFDRAQHLKARGLLGPAHDACSEFLVAQSKYQPGKYDYLFMRDRDVHQAIRSAKEMLTELQAMLLQNDQVDPNAANGQQPYQW